MKTVLPSGRVCGTAAVVFSIFASALPADETMPTRDDVLARIRQANDYWIGTHANAGNTEWPKAVYHTGNMACYFATRASKYLSYSTQWAQQNNWLIYDDTTSNHQAIDQCCGQTYIELYTLAPDPRKIANIRSNMDFMLTRPNDFFKCVDETYMSGPIYSKLTALTAERKYADKLYAGFLSVKSRFFDTTDKLWYRDGQYKYPAFQTPNGEKCFWSRGNGWAIGACARILQSLPASNPNRGEYAAMIQAMAGALRTRQRTDGFWNMSLDDPNDYGGPETSGTALFVFGMAYGINAGLLDRETHLPIVLRGWNGMVDVALHPSGRLGYVQPRGERPVPGVTYDSTEYYGVGAFLLAGEELLKLIDAAPTPAPRTTPTPTPTPTPRSRVRPTPTPTATPTPTPTPRPRAGAPLEITPGASGVAASTSDANLPANAVDNNLATRWSGNGDGAWLRLDLGTERTVSHVGIGWYNGNTRTSRFDLQTSTDGTTWLSALTGITSSGATTLEQAFDFSDRTARYVRYVGHGNSVNTWNSVTEISVFAPAP